MEESKERAGHSRDEEATSKETLSDVEEGEKVSTPSETGSPTEGASPRPPAGHDSADGSETGGPM